MKMLYISCGLISAATWKWDRMSRPLIIAFMFSLVLHGGLLCLCAFPPTPRPPVLRALLRLPPDPEEVPKPIQTVETLFKNTIENGQA